MMDHRRPRPVYKLCLQQAGKQKRVGNAVISATAFGTAAPGGPTDGVFLQGSQKEAGRWEGAGLQAQDSETANPLVGPGDRWQGRAVWLSLGGRSFRVT